MKLSMKSALMAFTTTALVSFSAMAAPEYTQIFGIGQDVHAYYLGSTNSADEDNLYLGSNELFRNYNSRHNPSSNIGDSVNLGVFAAGTDIVFSLKNTNTGNVFDSGPTSQNFDVTPNFLLPNTFFVGVNDSEISHHNNYDDYSKNNDNLNDFFFAVTNVDTVSPSPVNDPNMFGVFAFIFAGIGFYKTRRDGLRAR